jgi:hypothetical protein
VDPDCCLKLLVDLVVAVSLVDLVLVDEELNKHVLDDLSALDSDIKQPEGLESLDDLAEGVRRDLVLPPTEKGLAFCVRLAEVQL